MFVLRFKPWGVRAHDILPCGYTGFDHEPINPRQRLLFICGQRKREPAVCGNRTNIPVIAMAEQSAAAEPA
jgi:hypothetical protein